MSHSYGEAQGFSEPRYDTEMLRKVTALAQRLQSGHEEKLTAAEIEAIGAEVGLKPAFIRQALSSIVEAQSAAPARQEPAPVADAEGEPTQAEKWVQTAVLVFPWWWVVITCLGLIVTEGPGEVAAFFFVLVPPPLTALLGFLSGKKKTAVIANAVLITLLSLGMAILSRSPTLATPLWFVFFYWLFGVPTAAGLGLAGASLRQAFLPWRRKKEGYSRQALLGLLGALQAETGTGQLRQAVLSVDVVDESAGSGVPAVVTPRLRAWIEEVARTTGGRTFDAGGDDLLCTFAEETAALRCARRLQEGAERLRPDADILPAGVSLRCGVSAGDAPEPQNGPYGTVADRAVALQKRTGAGDILVSAELAATGLLELGMLAPELRPGAEPAFSWRSVRTSALPG